MELLSPAGSMKSLIAAAMNGADAVYFGTGSFSARRFAGNFDGDELKNALDYCRLRDIKTYITVNTLVFDKEMQQALEYAAELYRLGADAIIVQDFGLACEIRKQLPQLDLHASTQMGIHDENGLRVIENLGFKRAVLSREVPMKNLPKLCSATNVDIEVFAHGAMCMSFSGNCLFSSMAGERSGNRGTCAQPCRKKISVYGLPGADDYVLSLSDMCMIEHLDEFKAAGVSCIKLEGRMKRPEYVAIVTRAYREALDGASRNEIERSVAKMLEMFERGGKRTGYYYGANGDIGPVTGCVAVSQPSNSLLKEALSVNNERTRSIAMSARVHVDEPITLKVSLDDKSFTVYGDKVQRADKPHSDNEARYIKQLTKLGGTPFSCSSCIVECDSLSFVPVSEINQLRRRAIEALSSDVTAQRNAIVTAFDNDLRIENVERSKVLVLVRNAESAQTVVSAGADWVALEPISYNAETLIAMQPLRKKAKLLLALPACVIEPTESDRLSALLNESYVDGAIAGNIGQIRLMDDLPIRVASSTMNTLNALTWKRYKQLGFTDFIVSEELTKAQLSDILKYGGGLKVYGRTALMQLRHCPVCEYKGCKQCKGTAGTLTDEAGRKFPLSNIVQSDGCLVRVLNCVPTDIVAQMTDAGLPKLVFAEFRTESPFQSGAIVNSIRRALSGEEYSPPAETTRGHWSRAID